MTRKNSHCVGILFDKGEGETASNLNECALQFISYSVSHALLENSEQYDVIQCVTVF